MVKNNNTLIILNDSYEAKQAVSLFKNSIIICLSLDAESFVKKFLPNYENPLYKIVLKIFKRGDRSYYWRNFKITRTWYDKQIFQYVQDSLGYFLTEFERSYYLASYLLKKFKPKKIIIGKQKYYKGFEIIHGNLDSAAIELLAKEKHIQIKFLEPEPRRVSIRSLIGKLIAKFTYTDLNQLRKADILLIVPGRHLIQMVELVNELKKKVIVLPVTYGLDWSIRKRLKNNFPDLIEKERLVNSAIKSKSKKRLHEILRNKDWQKFVHPKFKNKKFVCTFLQDWVFEVVQNQFESILIDMLLADEILTRIKPLAIINTTDPDTKVLPYIDKAKALGIVTIGLQHGADFTTENPTYNAASDYHIAWSKLAQRWAKKNIPKVKVLAGHSQFHKLKKSTFKKSSNHLTVLFLSTMKYYEREIPFFLKKLVTTLSEQKQKISLLIRTHPSQPLDNLRGLFTSKKIEVKWANSESLDETISQADVVLFENTTAGLDAMLAGKVVIYFNPYDGDDYFSLESRGIPTILKSDEIDLKIRYLFQHKNRWKSISESGRKFAVEYLGLSSNKDRKLAKLISKIIDGL